MRYGRVCGFLLAIVLALECSAWAQGGAARGAATPGGAAVPQGGQTGRGGGRGGGVGGGGADGLYTFDATASAGPALSDAQPVETHQKINVAGDILAYTARAGFLRLRNATTGQPAAHVFFTSYSKDGSVEASRPLVVFLGGAPGVAAAWQEFGGLGPKRMKWADDGSSGPPPYAWIDNTSTLLTHADLVFANPVGTSLSRSDQPNRAPEFWNTSGDAASMGEFIRGFLGQYDRRHSPLILAGEDSGTARAAAVAVYLIDHQTPVAGIVLLSMTPSADALAGDEQYINALPSQVLAAWHHKKLAPDLQALGADQLAAQARAFASREYLHALYKGDRMGAEERSAVAASLSRLTGVSKAFIVNNDLRLPADRFNAELLRDQHKALSATDARVAGFLPGSTGGGRGGFGGGASAAIDYAPYNLGGGFLTAYETYLRRELSFTDTSGSVLYLSGGGVGSYSSTGSDEASLAAAFVRDPRLRLFAGVSLFDQTVPFFAAEFTLAHLNVSPDVQAGNITIRHYEAGQKPYLDSRARARLKDDLAKFITDTVTSARR